MQACTITTPTLIRFQLNVSSCPTGSVLPVGKTKSCSLSKIYKECAFWDFRVVTILKSEQEAGPKKGKRNRVSVPSYFLPEEKLLLEEKAKQCSLSVSNYIRDVSLGYQPKSTSDAKAVLELVRINADLGRLGGLLKLLLTDEGKHLDAKAHRPQINELLHQIGELQMQLKIEVTRIRK